MGMSAIAPMIQYAEARHGEDLKQEACKKLIKIPVPTPPKLKQIISDHCTIVPPPGG